MVALLTAFAICCWALLCLLDLLAYWPALEPDRVISPLLSGLILLIALLLVVWRRCCLPMQAVFRRLKAECGQELMNRGCSKLGCHPADSLFGLPRAFRCFSRGKELRDHLFLLIVQWVLLIGCLIWLVFHAANEREPQATVSELDRDLPIGGRRHLRGLLAACAAALQPRRGLRPPISAHFPHPEALLLRPKPPAPCEPEPVELEAAPRTSLRSSESAQSANVLGHVLSGPRASLGAHVEVQRLRDDDGHGRSSRGRWRPLFPTLTASVLLSPTVSRSTASMGLGDSFRRSRELKREGGVQVKKSLRFDSNAAKAIIVM